MRKFTKFILVVFLLVPLTIFSQVRPGQFIGTVTDSSSGEALTGANVMIKGTSIGTPTNIDGKFAITKIQPGDYTLRISYIGYNTKEIDVKLPSGKTVKLDIKLSAVSLKGEEVKVTAQAVGQNEAINEQIQSIPIMNIVSSTKIRELPDPNAAAALARLPGISIERKNGEAEQIRIRGVNQNTYYVNGMRMEGSNLAAISSNMMGGLQVQKSFTPDMDADVTGGAVSVKMLEAKPGLKTDIWVSNGYNDLTGSFKIFNASVLLSNRFFNDKLGAVLSLTYDKRDRGAETFNGTFQTVGSAEDAEVVKPVYIYSANTGISENIRNRYGATLYLDYKLGESKLFYQGFLAYMDWSDKRYTNNFSPFYHYSLTYQATISEANRLTFLNGIGGEHPLFGGTFDWSAFYSKSVDDSPKQMGIWAEGSGLNGGNTIDSTSTWNDMISLADHDLKTTSLHGAWLNSDSNRVIEKTVNINYKIPFVITNDVSGFIKIGGKYRNVHREFEHRTTASGFEQDWVYGTEVALERLPDFGWKRANNGKLGYETFVTPGSKMEYSILNDYVYFIPDFDRLRTYWDATSDTYLPNLAAEVNNYWGDENLYAGYAMASFKFGNFIDFIPGIRYEKVNFNTTGIKFLQNKSGGPVDVQGNFDKVSDESSNENWFPMAQLKVKVTDFLDIRLAYSKTVARPSFRYLSPKFFESAQNNLEYGNMDLLPQKNYNYDIYASFYSNHIGLFTIGAFYKELTDQVLNYQIIILDPEKYGLSPSYKSKTLLKPINNQWPGWVKGLEFEWQTHFWYLPGFLDGLLLSANVTFMDSETKYPFFSFKRVYVGPPLYYQSIGKDSSRTNKVIGQPDLLGNVTLGYEKGGFSGRISMYYQGPTITDAQRQNKALDVNHDELVRFDVQLSQKLFIEGLIFYLNFNNITGTADIQSLTYYPQHLKHEENYGWTGQFGVRYKF